ncbi:hypothetical protein C6502_16255 [Candidatus Poribacteria bacterium]|nr:MAG: hypothetical protein C6502_16255 [Candidatus Poribacteria bacterium]
MGTGKAQDKAFKRSGVWRFKYPSVFYVSRFTFYALRFALFGFVVFVFCGNVAYSQDITVSAAVTPKIISLNETATLRVTISANQQLGNIAAPKLKASPEFDVSYGASSSQYNLSGNQISVSVTWTYVLRPKKVGQFTVPSIQISHGNKTYTADPISIKVLPKSEKPSQSESTQDTFTDAFSSSTHKVEASVDNSRPYVNEQIIYTFRYLYTARIPSFNSPKYTRPSLRQFWTTELERNRAQRKMIDGTLYWIEEIRVGLFPITAGRVTIEPAKLSLPLSTGRGRPQSPNVLITNPVEVDVRPLPQQGRPTDFVGTVGQYRIHAQTDRQTIETGDGFTLRMQVSGTGNIKTVPTPIVPTLPNMAIYDPQITDAIRVVDSKVRGSRTYEYVIIPSKEGDWTIPAIDYPYFDPQTDSYQVARTMPITINVLPNSDGAVGTTPSHTTQSDIHLLKQDIRYIKPDSLKLSDQHLQPYKRISFWVVQTLPIAVVLLVWFYRQRQAKRDPKQLREQYAAKNALQIIEAAKKHPTDEPTIFYGTLANGLYQYIGDIFDVSPGGLNPELVRQRCEAAGFPESATTQIVDTLTQCDYVRFAPVAANPTDMEDAFNRARTSINEIEKERQLKIQ